MTPSIFFAIGLVTSIVGSYFISNTISQRVWKEKIPQRKLLGFLGIFLVSFLMLGCMVVWASLATFGR